VIDMRARGQRHGMKTLIAFSSCIGLVACGGTVDFCRDNGCDDGGAPDVVTLDVSVDVVDASTSDGPIFGDATTPIVDAGQSGCAIATLGVVGASDCTLFQNWLNGNKTAIGDLKDSVLTPTLLQPYRMLIVLDVTGNHTYSANETAVLQAWVSGGGGLMTLAGYEFNGEPNLNLLLAPFNIQTGDTGIMYDVNNLPTVTQWTPHPITTGISILGFNNGLTVSGSGTALAGQNYQNTYYNVLMAEQFGQGHVVAWGDEWISRDLLWTQHPEMQVQKFWQNVVDWLDPKSGCAVPTPK
jgi:hypothetical protein